MNPHYKIEKPDSILNSFSSEMKIYPHSISLDRFISQYLHRRIRYDHISEIASRPLPSGNIFMVVQFGPPIRVYDCKFQHSQEYVVFITGVHTLNEVTYISPTGQIENLMISFKPVGFYLIFGVNANKIKNSVVDLHNLIGDKADKLMADCENACSYEEKFKIIDLFFESCLVHKDTKADTAKFELMLTRIQNKKGLVNLHQLCEEFALPNRTFERHFNQYIGVSPKEYIEIIRFNSILDYFLNSAKKIDKNREAL